MSLNQPDVAIVESSAQDGDFANNKIPLDNPDKFSLYSLFVLWGGSLIILAFFFNSPHEIWTGSLVILTSPANLLTDYFALANIGSTMLNAGVMALVSTGLARINRIRASGALTAAIFTMSGFAFFGKNLLNSIPIILGVLLYAYLLKTPFKSLVLLALFGTSLSPLVSEIAFNLGLPTAEGLILGFAAGLATGLVLPPLASYFMDFHKGFNLYNTGFTTGVIGMFFLAVLRANGIEVLTVSILSTGNALPLALILSFLFVLLLFAGLGLNRWSLRGYLKLTKESGQLHTDFVQLSGTGITLINMAFLGLMSIIFVLANGGEINGPIIGAILTVTGFGAYGKHLRNTLPILAGVLLANLFNIHDRSSTLALTAALFGTTLAPIAGRYGIFAGVIAGFLHMAIVVNIRDLHGGMNLYNNGFSGGFIAAVLVPLFNAASQAWKLIWQGRRGKHRGDS